MKLPPVAIVKWGDAFIDNDDFKIKDAGTTVPVGRYTSGFYITENQHGIVLSTDVYVEGDEAASKMFVPWGMIDDWWLLEH